MTSRLVTLITLITAVVGCVAAVVVVPEVRCMLGLPTSETVCVRHQRAPGLSSSLLPERSGEEAAVDRVKALYRRVEREHHTGRYDSIRKEITGTRGDSAYATIYFSRGGVPKIRARIFRGNERTSILTYYDGGDLVFVHRKSSHLPVTGDEAFDEQRFYFAGGRMIRWLRGTDARNVASGADGYDNFEKTMGEVGNLLLEGARSPDPLIAF
jgi:hypothetical protein